VNIYYRYYHKLNTITLVIMSDTDQNDNIRIVLSPNMDDVPAKCRRYYGVQKINTHERTCMINRIPKELIQVTSDTYNNLKENRNKFIDTEHFTIKIDEHGNMSYVPIHGGEEILIWSVYSDETANLTFHKYQKNPHINPWTILSRRANAISFRPYVSSKKSFENTEQPRSSRTTARTHDSKNHPDSV